MKFFEICLLPVGGRREKKTFETLKNLSKTVVKSVEKFEEGVEAYTEQKFDKGKELLREVDEIESEADKYGFRFESELREGAFLPAFRGDLSRLAESVDDIADMAEESAKEIYRRPRVFEELAEAEEEEEDVKSIRLGLVELAEKAVASAEATDKAISILMDDMEEAAQRAEAIHRRERESDSKEDELSIKLYQHEQLFKPVTVMQIRILIDKFGSISNAAEDSGDIISALTTSLKA